MACVCFLAVCLGVVGCTTLSNFGKKLTGKDKPPPGQPPSSQTALPAPPDNPGLASTERVPQEVNGVLAGRVLDSYDRRPPPTFIQVVLAQDNRSSKSQPLEVATDSQGYFTIHGLQPGSHYQLIARTRDGEAKLAGTTWATPPNPRLLIYMSGDFATPNTPAAPQPPTVPGQKSPKWPEKSSSTDGSSGENSSGDSNSKPSNSIAPQQRAADIGAPLKTIDTTPNQGASSGAPAQPKPEVRPQDIVDNGQAMLPPVGNIPFQGDASRQDAGPQSSPIPAVATRVPSCVLTGRQLENFALNDLNAQPWEYRNHRGKVVLLDFWGTWCVPCRQAIFHLKTLQENYGPYGLEVVGIAYEEGSLQDQIRKVQGVRDRLGINYRLLLGSEIATCPVKTQFAVSNFPTLILLDANNRIIWRQEGLDAYRLQELDVLIRQQLRVH
jgi:thiol-disulfide isomerase/thioredoxin